MWSEICPKDRWQVMDAVNEGSQPVNSDGSYKWKYHPEELLTPDQTAEVLNSTTKTLSRNRSKGEGPKFVKISRSKVGYVYKDILDWIKSRTFESTHDAYEAGMSS